LNYLKDRYAELSPSEIIDDQDILFLMMKAAMHHDEVIFNSLKE